MLITKTFKETFWFLYPTSKLNVLIRYFFLNKQQTMPQTCSSHIDRSMTVIGIYSDVFIMSFFILYYVLDSWHVLVKHWLKTLNITLSFSLMNDCRLLNAFSLVLYISLMTYCSISSTTYFSQHCSCITAVHYHLGSRLIHLTKLYKRCKRHILPTFLNLYSRIFCRNFYRGRLILI